MLKEAPPSLPMKRIMSTLLSVYMIPPQLSGRPLPLTIRLFNSSLFGQPVLPY